MSGEWLLCWRFGGAALWGGYLGISSFAQVNKKPLVLHLLYHNSGRNQLKFPTRQKKTGPAPLPPGALPHFRTLRLGQGCVLPTTPTSRVSLACGLCPVYCLHMPLENLFLKWSDKVALLFPVAHVQPRVRLAVLWEDSSTRSPSPIVQLESVFLLLCPKTVVSLKFLWMWLKNVCVLATIANKLCSAIQHTDPKRAWPHYQNWNPDGEESQPNEGLSVISHKFLVNHATLHMGSPFRDTNWSLRIY